MTKKTVRVLKKKRNGQVIGTAFPAPAAPAPQQSSVAPSSPVPSIQRRHLVQSSSVHAIGYDPDSWTLDVEFSNGAVYRYARVRPEVFCAVMNAESIGASVRKLIVEASYAYEKRTS